MKVDHKKKLMRAADIGENVRKHRRRIGISSTELAKRVRVSQAQISRLETGQQGFRSSTLVQIARVLGVAPWFLFMTAKEQEEHTDGAFVR